MPVKKSLFEKTHPVLRPTSTLWLFKALLMKCVFQTSTLNLVWSRNSSTNKPDYIYGQSEPISLIGELSLFLYKWKTTSTVGVYIKEHSINKIIVFQRDPALLRNKGKPSWVWLEVSWRRRAPALNQALVWHSFLMKL